MRLILHYFSNSQIDNYELGRFGTANQAPFGGQDTRIFTGLSGSFHSGWCSNDDPGCPADQRAGATCLYDYGPSSIAVPEAERMGAILSMNRDVNDSVELFAEIAAQHNTSNAGGAATPLDEGAGLTVPGTHPNNPFWSGC